MSLAVRTVGMAVPWVLPTVLPRSAFGGVDDDEHATSAAARKAAAAPASSERTARGAPGSGRRARRTSSQSPLASTANVEARLPWVLLARCSSWNDWPFLT